MEKGTLNHIQTQPQGRVETSFRLCWFFFEEHVEMFCFVEPNIILTPLILGRIRASTSYFRTEMNFWRAVTYKDYAVDSMDSTSHSWAPLLWPVSQNKIPNNSLFSGFLNVLIGEYGFCGPLTLEFV